MALPLQDVAERHAQGEQDDRLRVQTPDRDGEARHGTIVVVSVLALPLSHELRR